MSAEHGIGVPWDAWSRPLYSLRRILFRPGETLPTLVEGPLLQPAVFLVLCQVAWLFPFVLVAILVTPGATLYRAAATLIGAAVAGPALGLFGALLMALGSWVVTPASARARISLRQMLRIWLYAHAYCVFLVSHVVVRWLPAIARLLADTAIDVVVAVAIGAAVRAALAPHVGRAYALRAAALPVAVVMLVRFAVELAAGNGMLGNR